MESSPTLYRVTAPENQEVCVCSRADRFASRLLGLMGRTKIPYGDALWIEPCRSIHAFFMRISIDVLFLNRDRVVVGRKARLAPWRVAWAPLGSHSVLEMEAGRLESLEVPFGTALRFQPIDSFDNATPQKEPS